MKSDDWIEFAKEKPQPGQSILVHWPDGAAQKIIWCDKVPPPPITHWQPWADPPKPDAFEEWWEPQNCGETTYKHFARQAWNAAVEWARKEKSSKP